MQINLELGYEYSKITVEEYEVDPEYTRHNAFLSGAKFQSGGIIATLNIVYSLNMRKN